MNEGRRSSGGIKGGLPVSSCRILLPPPAAAAPALGAAEEEVADTCVREDPWEAVLFRGRLMKGDAQIGDGRVISELNEPMGLLPYDILANSFSDPDGGRLCVLCIESGDM